MEEKPRTHESWIDDATKLSKSELHDVCTCWKRRADRIGLVVVDVPDPEHSTKQEMAEWSWKVRERFLLRRRQIEAAYDDSVLEAIHSIEHGCVLFERAKRILDEKGHHLGLLSDIEGLTERLVAQLETVEPEEVQKTRDLVEGCPSILFRFNP